MEILFGIAIYLLPGFYALLINHRDKNMIFKLNIILGWTIIAWIILGVWAIFFNWNRVGNADESEVEESEVDTINVKNVKTVVRMVRPPFVNKDYKRSIKAEPVLSSMLPEALISPRSVEFHDEPDKSTEMSGAATGEVCLSCNSAIHESDRYCGNCGFRILFE